MPACLDLLPSRAGLCARPHASAWSGPVVAALPLAAMAIGGTLPGLADAAFDRLGWLSVGTLFIGSVTMDRPASGARHRGDWRFAVPVTLVLSFLSSLAAWGLARLLDLGPDLAGVMTLLCCSPATGVALTMTGLIGLHARPIALVVLSTNLLAPAAVPLVATLFGDAAAVDPVAMLSGTVRLVLLPMGLAFALRGIRLAPAGRRAARAAGTQAGLALMIALAIARSHGLSPALLGHPGHLVRIALLAWGTLGLSAILAALVAARGTRQAAIVAAVCRGGTVWAILAPTLSQEATTFMVMASIPTYALPPLLLAGRWRGART